MKDKSRYFTLNRDVPRSRSLFISDTREIDDIDCRGDFSANSMTPLHILEARFDGRGHYPTHISPPPSPPPPSISVLLSHFTTLVLSLTRWLAQILIRSYAHILTLSLSHSFTCSYAHTLIRSHAHMLILLLTHTLHAHLLLHALSLSLLLPLLKTSSAFFF